MSLFSSKKSGKGRLEISVRSGKPGESAQDVSNLSPRTPPVLLKAKTTFVFSKSKRMSTGGIFDLVQCPLCLEKLCEPKMLPCQHTFCLDCLRVQISKSTKDLTCPICHAKSVMQGHNFLDNLPSNLYIDSLLKLLAHDHDQPNAELSPNLPSPTTQSTQRCSLCKTVCDLISTSCCSHCKCYFCKVCWAQHLEDLKTQIGSILRQLDSAANRLDHKVDHFKDRCERLLEQINETADSRMQEIVAIKEAKINEAQNIIKKGELSALALRTSLNEARSTVKDLTAEDNKFDTLKSDHQKISTFMNFHQTTLHILNELAKYDEVKFVFDKERFSIDEDVQTPSEAETDVPEPINSKNSNPLESEDNMILHYRTRHFTPRFIWRKCARPGGLGVDPWSDHLYVCGLDARHVLVVERTRAKIVARLTNPNMLCPMHVAFMKSLGEVYVTDKWKHCVHVFSKDGEYLRSIGSKGNPFGCFRSPEGIAVDNAKNHIYVVDTGNDRVQILQPDGTFVAQIGVMKKSQPHASTPTMWETIDYKCTELNAPSSIAVTANRVIILDSGNRRVKVYDKEWNKLFDFGSFGSQKGQFRQPEVLTVDPLGFILVGDSGNTRVQVFKPSGQLVRVFGGYGTEDGKFRWISGIYVTKQLDVIISDTKNHQINIFFNKN